MYIDIIDITITSASLWKVSVLYILASHDYVHSFDGRSIAWQVLWMICCERGLFFQYDIDSEGHKKRCQINEVISIANVD